MTTHRESAPAVLFVCTGNAARSVLASAFLAHGTQGMSVESAGTHAFEGMPPGRHVRAVLRDHDVGSVSHRSASLHDSDLARADLVIALATEHVRYVRTHHGAHAARTGTLRRLARDLEPTQEPLAARVARLALDQITLEGWEDVDDPAGADLDTYRRCGREIAALIEQLGPKLVGRATLF
jgi:protein-tyrosine phosphatase